MSRGRTTFRGTESRPILPAMLTMLRQSRLLALVLLLLAPGVSGSAVQWAHACPAESAQATTSDHQHHDTGSDQSPACECIGQCTAAGVVLLPAAVIARAASIRPQSYRATPSGESFVPVGTPSDLLPPATAPPLS
jgi:hypothetical protein